MRPVLGRTWRAMSEPRRVVRNPSNDLGLGYGVVGLGLQYATFKLCGLSRSSIIRRV